MKVLEAALKRDILVVTIPRRIKIALSDSEFDVSRYLVPTDQTTNININVTINNINFSLSEEYRESLSQWQEPPQPIRRCENCGWVSRVHPVAWMEDSDIQHDLELSDKDSENDFDEITELLTVAPATFSNGGVAAPILGQQDASPASPSGLPILPYVLPSIVGVPARLLPVPTPAPVVLIPPARPVPLPVAQPIGGGDGNGDGGGGTPRRDGGDFPPGRDGGGGPPGRDGGGGPPGRDGGGGPPGRDGGGGPGHRLGAFGPAPCPIYYPTPDNFPG